MNITIKITHANGTVMDISIPIAIEQLAPAVTTPDETHVASEPAIPADDEPPYSVEPDDIRPSGKRYKSVVEMVEANSAFYGPEVLEALKEELLPEPEPPQETGDQFPCQDGFYSIPPNLYADFCSAFGQTMVDRELTLACLWIKSNPTKRKTRRGMSRYLNAWLCRSQGEKRQALKGRTGSLLDSAPSSQKGW